MLGSVLRRLSHPASVPHLRPLSPFAASGDDAAAGGSFRDPVPSAVAAGRAADAGRDATLARVGAHPTQTVALTLNRFGPRGVAWMLPRMQLSKPALARLPECQFAFLMGTGGGAGFSTRPNLAVWTLLTAHRSGAGAAASFEAPPLRARAARARESLTVFLAPISSRGTWAGHAFAPGPDPEPSGPVAALTRASVRGRALVPFWRRVPAISDALVAGSEARLALGMGEVPYLHQVTFSVWDDVAAMRRFAGGAAHGEAARQVYENGWFSEELFARFRVLGAIGRWNGRDGRDIIPA